jgi:hypothetical protein
MLKQLTCLMVIVMMVGVASADLVAHWTLNETSGETAHDKSGNGHDGSLIGGPQWVQGMLGGAAAFDGVDDYIDFGNPQDFPAGTSARSITAWVTTTNLDGGWVAAAAYGSPAGSQAFGFARNGRLLSGFGYGNDLTVADFFETDTWYHLALTYDGSTASLYVDGELMLADAKVWNLNLSRAHIGRQINDAAEFWAGNVDDVRVYSHTLSPTEIHDVMIGTPELSANPDPEDGMTDVVRDVLLSWAPGEFAVSHNVYLGTAFDDVNAADVDSPLLVSPGQADTVFDAGTLEFGQTYYWRVDEVNGAPDRTVFAGNVWSFTVEPFSIPVASITATASSANAANMGPENTINGIGLNELDQHSTEGTEMWLSGVGDAAPWIQYEFDKTYKLHEMWVWNSNQLIESFVGIGAKDVVIEYSTDGDTWTILADASEFAQAPGTPMYTANTMVDFAGVIARFVRITVNAGWGMMPQYGLSEVRFLYVPTLPREPQPMDGAVTKSGDVTLKWRAGREAASHEVYLGTAADNLVLIATTSASTHTATGLDYDQSYVWQIVEVNDAEAPASYVGDLWSFSTPPYYAVDEFERYNDNCARIFFAWEDGLGHNGGVDIDDCDVPASNGNGGGSIVGNNASPFAEQTIVHSGAQSMPLSYDNSFGPSETTLQLASMDWTASGIKSLSLYFYGASDNTGQLYVMINNTKVLYSGEATDIAHALWQPWIIDLSAVGGNLQNVTTLSIGVDGASAAGQLYIDDIRLYPLTPQSVTPIAPDNTNLLAHYALDGDATDSSGNGHDGVVEGGVSFVDGVLGQGSDHNGFDALINGGDVPVGDAGAISIAFWVKPRNISQNWAGYVSKWTLDDSERTFWLGQHATDGWLRFGIYPGGPTAETALDSGQAILANEEWTHIGCTYDGSIQKIYAGGVEIAASPPRTGGLVDRGGNLRLGIVAAGNWFDGSLDDVHVYSRALSLEELAWLAGKRTSMVKPF